MASQASDLRSVPPQAAAYAPSFGERSRLRFFPYLLERSTDNDFSLRRLGTGQRVFTRRVGVDAVRLLEEGLTVEATRERLAAQLGCAAESINLAPLLGALDRAGLIREVDGVPLQRGRRLTVRQWWCHEFYPLMWTRVYGGLRKLPSAWLAGSLAVLNALYPNAKRRLILSMTEANMASAFPQLPRRKVRKLARTHFRHQVRIVRTRQVATLLAERLSSGSDERVLRSLEWLAGRSDVSGLEHLEAAHGQGRGVILCGFHIGFINRIPFILARRGWATTSLGLVHRSIDEAMYRILRERMVALGWAPFTMLPQIDLKGLAILRSLLERGETILLFGDAHIDNVENEELMRYLGNELKTYRPSQVPTPLLGKVVGGNKGIAWLHETTGAAVLPTALFRDDGGRETLVLRPALPPRVEPTARERIAGNVRAVYAELEQLVRERPEQWSYWKYLHRM